VLELIDGVWKDYGKAFPGENPESRNRRRREQKILANAVVQFERMLKLPWLRLVEGQIRGTTLKCLLQLKKVSTDSDAKGSDLDSALFEMWIAGYTLAADCGRKVQL
jgi:hypothetical protein